MKPNVVAFGNGTSDFTLPIRSPYNTDRAINLAVVKNEEAELPISQI